MERSIIDLHTHSTESDGTFTPEELMREAARVGLSAIALTDHDTTGGIAKARPVAKSLGIELIPGVELSTTYEGCEVHIVGLFIDENNEFLCQKLAEFRACRDSRNEKMVEALQKEGLAITMKELLAENQDCVITRANIARFLYEHRQIRSIKEAFDRYIGDHGKCYVGRFKVTPMEAVSMIRKAGGIAILAHPVLYHMSNTRLNELVKYLKDVGLTGIEAIYSTYSTSDEHFIKRIAKEYDLCISGGSDFHGENKPTIQLGTGCGHLYVPYSVLEELKLHL
ncbi:PHP domain-containing protein [Roseburia sp. 831b]|uniref:PHP domain-containing protein n=1 Tax=Roseburia sp. 831b TaxID=1261635 RepID=UPI000952C374|nr:PHP domain-containing protein [Roseburia sp. 831b]WVK73892.1 PHP domain-containing protein [Roseburia sp. 831b]